MRAIANYRTINKIKQILGGTQPPNAVTVYQSIGTSTSDVSDDYEPETIHDRESTGGGVTLRCWLHDIIASKMNRDVQAKFGTLWSDVGDLDMYDWIMTWHTDEIVQPVEGDLVDVERLFSNVLETRRYRVTRIVTDSVSVFKSAFLKK